MKSLLFRVILYTEKMKFMVQILKISLYFFVVLFLSQCGDNSSDEISRGHRDAIKYECENDPDEKLCGKEVRLKFKRDGHEYVTFEDLSKGQKNRVQTNCTMEKKFGLVAYNECLNKYKQLALGNELTQDKEEVKITSHIDRIKESSYHVIAMWKNKPKDGSEGASGTGIAIAKNLMQLLQQPLKLISQEHRPIY